MVTLTMTVYVITPTSKLLLVRRLEIHAPSGKRTSICDLGWLSQLSVPRRTEDQFESLTRSNISSAFEHLTSKKDFGSTCYHDCCCDREGDCLAAKLWPGNVESADDWEELLLRK